MKKLMILSCLVAILTLGLAFIPCQSQAADKFITISTTTSTENTGLLEYLLPLFTKDSNIEVRVIAKGTGAAIKDGMDGNVDAILVHDPIREAKYVQDGYGTKREYIMYNDFVVLGPESDPAKVKSTKTSQAAFTAIAKIKAPFISRGDDSGTHSKEASIWAKSEATLKGKYPEDTSWYFSIGQGMGKAILMANEKQGYTLADRGTYNSMKFADKPTTNLIIVQEGDLNLLNPYGYIPTNPTKYPKTKITEAEALGAWLVSEKGKKAIREFKTNGQPLFFPDALPNS